MYWKLYLCVCLCTTVLCKNITYNVVSLVPSGYSMAVMVDDVAFPLTPAADTAILYVGKAPIAQTGYHYVKLNDANVVERESFRRSKVEENTLNEFYNRTWNSKQIAKLPQVFEPLPIMDRVESKLHVDGQIPVIYISGNATGIALLHSNATDDIKVTVNMTRISLDKTETFSNVQIELAGRSSRWFPKVSYNIKLAKKDELYGYRQFKLRAMATDPSYLREQVSYDIIKATGLPSTESSFVRLFINDRAFGLFGFIENYKTPWYSNEFKDKTKGIAYQSIGGTSDLRYYSNESEFAASYKIKADPGKGQGPSNYEKLIGLTKFLAKSNTDDWGKWFNMDSVLRNLALEILLGYADGYIANANNYYIYYYSTEERFVYLPSDLDLGMGSTLLKLDLMWSGNYTEYPGFTLRPLTTKIIQIPKYKRQLENVMEKLARDLINLSITGKRVDDLVDMIREDVVWDQSLSPINSWALSITSVDSPGVLLPSTWDKPTLLDFGNRMVKGVAFDAAVNGPTGHISLTGVKEWIDHQSQSILRFLSTVS